LLRRIVLAVAILVLLGAGAFAIYQSTGLADMIGTFDNWSGEPKDGTPSLGEGARMLWDIFEPLLRISALVAETIFTR